LQHFWTPSIKRLLFMLLLNICGKRGSKQIIGEQQGAKGGQEGGGITESIAVQMEMPGIKGKSKWRRGEEDIEGIECLVVIDGAESVEIVECGEGIGEEGSRQDQRQK
jgi:hypothetical protein